MISANSSPIKAMNEGPDTVDHETASRAWRSSPVGASGESLGVRQWLCWHRTMRRLDLCYAPSRTVLSVLEWTTFLQC